MNIIIIYSWIYNWAFLCVLLIYLTYHVSTNGTFCLFAFLSQSYHVTLPGLGTHRASPASASKVLEWKVCTPMPDSAQCVSLLRFYWSPCYLAENSEFSWLFDYFWTLRFLYKFKNQFVSLNQEITTIRIMLEIDLYLWMILEQAVMVYSSNFASFCVTQQYRYVYILCSAHLGPDN